MKVIIAGSRIIVDYQLVANAIEASGFDITEVVQGEARGVDSLGKQWAIEHNIPHKPFKPNYNFPPAKLAPSRRNTEMAEYVGPDGGLILIWNGRSSGSRDMLTKALNRNLKIHKYIATDREVFDGLAKKWKKETKFVSNTNRKIEHQCYGDIISMGECAVNLMLEDLQQGPCDWYWALTSIIGIDPVPKEAEGDTEKMAAAWLDWAKKNNRNISEKIT